MNPAFAGVEAAHVLFVVEIGKSLPQKLPELLLAEKRRLQFPFRDGGETQRRKRAFEYGVGSLFADSGAQVRAPLSLELKQLFRRELPPVHDPDRQNAVSKIVPQFRIGRTEITAEFLRQSKRLLARRDLIVVRSNRAPERLVVDRIRRLLRICRAGNDRQAKGQQRDGQYRSEHLDLLEKRPTADFSLRRGREMLGKQVCAAAIPAALGNPAIRCG